MTNQASKDITGFHTPQPRQGRDLSPSDALINLENSDQPIVSDSEYIPAAQAISMLGISAATLYAYVSRGLVESRPGEDHRSRVYRRRDIERLASRKSAGRGAARGAAQSLDRGLPVMETQISLIRANGPYYRGRSAVDLVRTGATLEDAARILWDSGDQDPFAAPPPVHWPATTEAIALNDRLPPLERALASIPLLALEVRHSFNEAPVVRREIAATLLRQNAALLVAKPASEEPVHQLLARCWKPNDIAFSEIVRAALVLCADHELNVSAFAARVVASTGAHLHATVCAGLAALSGPRHGGATARAYALINEALIAPSLSDFVSERWRRGDDMPGFSHALYPNGDPRATELLSMLKQSSTASEPFQRVLHLIEQVDEISGQRPNIDFMLATICHANDLPAAPALVLFAAGRVAGWLAHALEQQTQPGVIRPRAHYAGIVPKS